MSGEALFSSNSEVRSDFPYCNMFTLPPPYIRIWRQSLKRYQAHKILPLWILWTEADLIRKACEYKRERTVRQTVPANRNGNPNRNNRYDEPYQQTETVAVKQPWKLYEALEAFNDDVTGRNNSYLDLLQEFVEEQLAIPGILDHLAGIESLWFTYESITGPTNYSYLVNESQAYELDLRNCMQGVAFVYTKLYTLPEFNIFPDWLAQHYLYPVGVIEDNLHKYVMDEDIDGLSGFRRIHDDDEEQAFADIDEKVKENYLKYLTNRNHQSVISDASTVPIIYANDLTVNRKRKNQLQSDTWESNFLLRCPTIRLSESGSCTRSKYARQN
jgi:hypothetical protein